MRIQLFCIMIMFVFIAGINLDTFAENTNNSDQKATTVLVVGHQSTMDFSTALIKRLEQIPLEVIVAPTKTKQEPSYSPYFLSTDHFVAPTKLLDINRSDSNFLTTSYLLQTVQRSYSEISVKDRARRNTNVVPQNKNIPSPTRTDIS